MKFFVTWNTKKFLKSLTNMQKATKPCALTSMKQATQFLRGWIVKNKLSGQVLHRRSGKLAGSIMGTARMEGGYAVGVVGSNLKYARIHELGLKRGSVIIRPKDALALHFYIGNKEIFAKKVKMYMPKRPYIKPSMDEAAPKIREILGVRFFTELATKGKKV